MTGRQGFRRWFAGQVLHRKDELCCTCLLFWTAKPVCRAGTTQNDGIAVYLPSFRDCRAGLRDRYYTERPNCGVPALGTCLGDGETGDRRWFAGQVLQKTTELWGTCLGDGETGVPEMVCGTGTTQNDRIMGHLPAFRDCRAGLRGRYYTKRRNCGAPACFSGLQSRFEGQVLHRKAELCCTCLSDGETGVPEPVCGTGTTQIGGIVGHLP